MQYINQVCSKNDPTLPIKFKFHVDPSWNGETKVFSNGPNNMTKKAIMPEYVIYDKNL